MSAFKSWFLREEARGDGSEITLEDAFEAGRNSVLGLHAESNFGAIFAKLDADAREAKIRLAGVLCYLRDTAVISNSKMLQLSDMTLHELNRMIDALDEIEE